MTQAKDSQPSLNSEEEERLDNLLLLARRFHHLCFVLAGISLALSTLESAQTFNLSIGNLKFPITQTSVGLFVAITALCSAIDWLYLEMALPWLSLDKRRVPFAWVASGGGRLSYFVWTRLPIVITGVGLTITFKNSGLLLLTLFLGLIAPTSPLVIRDYAYILGTREDKRGGPATYSIWLLYWFRMIRALLIVAFYFLGVFQLIPAWEQGTNQLSSVFMICILLLGLVRLVGSFPLVYRWLDKRGMNRGFPQKSQHYS